MKAIATLAALALLIGCGKTQEAETPPGPEPADMATDDALPQSEVEPVPTTNVDSNPADCKGLDYCACRDRADCQMVTEKCFCPAGQPCESASLACVCGGGQYLGCEPK